MEIQDPGSEGKNYITQEAGVEWQDDEPIKTQKSTSFALNCGAGLPWLSVPGSSGLSVSLLRGQYLLTRMSSVEGAGEQVTSAEVRDSDAAVRVSGARAVTGSPTAATPPGPAAPAPLRPRSPAAAAAEPRRPAEVSARPPGLRSAAGRGAPVVSRIQAPASGTGGAGR